MNLKFWKILHIYFQKSLKYMTYRVLSCINIAFKMLHQNKSITYILDKEGVWLNIA